MSEPLRVLIVDDHQEFVAGLRSLLSIVEGLEVVGNAFDGRAAVEACGTLQPDVVLMDLHMHGMNGVEATGRIVAASPHIAVLVLTMLEDDESVFAAMRAGARGYLLKGANRADIDRAISAVAGGQLVFGPGVASRVLRYFSGVTPERATDVDAFPQLTLREHEVLTLIAEGRDNTEIARQLVLSAKTVRNHVSNIFAKLQVAHRAQAIVMARDAGLGVRGPLDGGTHGGSSR